MIYFARQKARHMNRIETYNMTIIPNSTIADLQNNDNQAVINSIVMIAEMQNNKPMGVTTYRTSDELPETLRKAMPDIGELKKLL